MVDLTCCIENEMFPLYTWIQITTPSNLKQNVENTQYSLLFLPKLSIGVGTTGTDIYLPPIVMLQIFHCCWLEELLYLKPEFKSLECFVNLCHIGRQHPFVHLCINITDSLFNDRRADAGSVQPNEVWLKFQKTMTTPSKSSTTWNHYDVKECSLRNG